MLDHLSTYILSKYSGKSYKFYIYVCVYIYILYQHINQNNILATEQYGFRNNSSNKKASFELMNKIFLALNNQLTIGGIFCDFEKAFYSINHDIPLYM